MADILRAHLDRVKAATVGKLGRKDLPKWIEKNTFINGKPFSFKGHEYQHSILLDESEELVVRKSAQTGISEMAMRMALGLVMVMPGAFRIGYTFPSASFAASYSKTRFNPIIQNSPVLKGSISNDDLDNSEVKTFGIGKEIYFKGAAVGNAAISTTLDMLIHDELSFSDQDVIGDYSSRIIHSEYKWRLALSTPTFPGDPIDEAFQASRRHFNMCKCGSCGHTFFPDYYSNVKVPGWDRHLDEITKDNLHLVRYNEAQFLCPSCWKPADLSPPNRVLVCENPSEPHIAAGYQVSPFDAPSVISLRDLIVSSTKYASKAKFRQFALGTPSADADSGLTDDDLNRIGVESVRTPFHTHCMGIDLGLTCHFAIGSLDSDGRLGIVHYERVPLARFRERYFQLKAEYRVSITVSDSQPYMDLIMSLSEEDPNLYGAVYVTRQGLELFEVKQKEADPDNALSQVRQVQINRNAVFDKFLADVRSEKVWVRKTADWELFKTHLQDMKRASATLRNGEFTSLWQKSSKGHDHYHHTVAAYLSTACQMRGLASGALGSGTPLVSTFRVKQKG